jgi:hypothetical protein
MYSGARKGNALVFFVKPASQHVRSYELFDIKLFTEEVQ